MHSSVYFEAFYLFFCYQDRIIKLLMGIFLRRKLNTTANDGKLNLNIDLAIVLNTSFIKRVVIIKPSAANFL